MKLENTVNFRTDWELCSIKTSNDLKLLIRLNPHPPFLKRNNINLCVVAMVEIEGTRMRENYDFTRSLLTERDSHVCAWAKKYLTLFSGSSTR